LKVLNTSWSIISEVGRGLIDIKTRIALAKDIFNKRKGLLIKRND